MHAFVLQFQEHACIIQIQNILQNACVLGAQKLADGHWGAQDPVNTFNSIL